MSIDITEPKAPPACQVRSCQHGAQIMAKFGPNVTYFKTCRRHTYQDLIPHKLQSNNNK